MVTRDQINKVRAVNIMDMVSRLNTLKKIANTGGGEYAGPCPLCGGTDRFHVQAGRNRWFCRHCTGDPAINGWKDAIDLQMRLTNQPFCEAVLSLNGENYPVARIAPQPANKPHQPAAMQTEAWQERGQNLVQQAQENLWGVTGARTISWRETNPETGERVIRHLSPREWLESRGLSEETLKRAKIGYIARSAYDSPSQWGIDGKAVWIPAGVLIPTLIKDQLWTLKIRQPVENPKYTQVRGGSAGLFQAETLDGIHEAACIVEGEFDAMLLRQELMKAVNPRWRNVGVVTFGSHSNRSDTALWGRYLLPIKRFLLLLDQDGKTSKSIAYWKAFSERVEIVTWRNLSKFDKDLTDYHRSGGRLLDLVAWALMK